MDCNAKSLKQKASGEKRQNRQLFMELKKMRPSIVDEKINASHDYHMARIDCLDCGNCCRTISPAIKDKDIDRIAKHLRKRPKEIVEQYLQIDEEEDYVFRSQPCPFLGDDNYCAIYTSRPKACREYPHTDRSKQHQIFDITLKNIAVCPIVYEIVRELREDFS